MDPETDDKLADMPLNAGDAGYGSVSGAGLAGGMDASEAAPLLIPEPDPDPVHSWQPLSRGELEAAAGGPGWRRLRRYLVLLFWLSWLAMLATAVAIIVVSPRPVVPPMRWWQKSSFYLMQPQLLLQADGSQSISVETEQLPFLKSLGIGALILQGLFDKNTSPLSLDALSKNMALLTQIQHLLTDIHKADLKVVLDFSELDLLGHQDAAENEDEPSNISATVQPAVRFWMEQGVAGFVICDTDEAYSEKTLLEWRSVFDEFSSQDEERIVVVRQTTDDVLPLSNSGQTNVTLVDVVMKSILPHSRRLLSVGQVAEAIETHLKTRDDDMWLSWTVGGKTSSNLNKLLLVLTMTLPGSPTVQYDEAIHQTRNMSVNVDSSRSETDEPSDTGKEDARRSAIALLTSLSHSRAREEALLYGSFTFLPFNASSYSAESPNATLSSPPVLAFLRSWGCVHFLILLNVGPEPHALDPAWAPSLPEAGVFVASTGLDRLGSTSLYTLELQPYEAIVIKLFQGGSYS